MTTLTTTPVLRKPAPPKETRVAPRPHVRLLKEWAVGDYRFVLTEEEGQRFPFYLTIGYEGLDDRRQGFDSVAEARTYAWHCTTPHRVEFPGPSTPIDQRALPQINGVGLEAHELSRVNRARNRAMSAYRCDCPPSDLDLVEHVGRQAAKDELRRTLRDRPHARPLAVKAKRDARDEQYWADFTMPAEVTPIRVRIGQRQARWDMECMDEGWGERNSGLVGHEA